MTTSNGLVDRYSPDKRSVNKGFPSDCIVKCIVRNIPLHTILIAIILALIGDDMKFITVSELRQRATQTVAEIESTKEEVIITKNGKPVVLMRYITDQDFMLKENKKGKEEDSIAKAKRKEGTSKGNL
jgi:PHD/YefM family antitoxin component YafN of YafNO toxin-antitoxin module